MGRVVWRKGDGMRIRTSLRLPKEHGAWAMVYVPFAIGALVAGSFSLRVALAGLAVTFLFISRESLLLWWRARSRGQKGIEPRKIMLIYMGAAAAAGLPLIIYYKLFWLAPLGMLTLALLVFNAQQALKREDRSISGETMAILGMTLSAPTAYYAACGSWDGTALWLWAMCALYFTSSIFYVKLRVYSLNRRRKQAERNSWRMCAVYHLFLLTALTIFAITGSLNLSALIAFAPALARSFWQLAKPAADLNLRLIGVMEIVYSLVFLVFITITFRVA